MAFAAAARAAEIKHDLLILDEGIWNLLRVDQNDPSKNWKFQASDLAERARWDDYTKARDDMFAASDTAQSPPQVKF